MLNGKIYKIYYINNPEIYYIGSTVRSLKERLTCHIKKYNMWLSSEIKTKCSICPYFKQYGDENFSIELLKEYSVVDIKHLTVYETLWIIKNKSAVNLKLPFALTVLKEYKKWHSKKNKNKNAIKKKEYRTKNKEKLSKKRKIKYLK